MNSMKSISLNKVFRPKDLFVPLVVMFMLILLYSLPGFIEYQWQDFLSDKEGVNIRLKLFDMAVFFWLCMYAYRNSVNYLFVFAVCLYVVFMMLVEFYLFENRLSLFASLWFFLMFFTVKRKCSANKTRESRGQTR